MSEGYRQKLLNFVCSMFLAWSAGLIVANLSWFVTLRDGRAENGAVDPFPALYALGESLIILVIFLILAISWHLLDFAQRAISPIRFVRLSTRYSTFVLTLTGFILANILLSTGYFTSNSCEQLDGALFHECYITISPWILIPWGIFGVSLLVLNVLKAVDTMISFSRTRRAPSPEGEGAKG
mgnify:FL=1